MAALICGSVAYDTIMVFNGQFKEHILADKIHMLNVSFLVPKLRREFGGCAGNIAYNLSLLGEPCHPMGMVGHDFAPYAAWLDKCGVSRKFLRELPDDFTAQAYITTDLNDNQITAFHPGAMEASHKNEVPLDAGIDLGIIAPDGRDGMLDHARQFAAAGIPFIFDPGQGLPMFDGQELTAFVDQADWIAVNDYEAQLLQERTGLTPAEIAARVKALIVTRGAEGSIVYTDGGQLEIPTATPEAVIDPTGCGDAYRAGLIYGINHGLEWEQTGRIAALLGAIKIEKPGTQNHRFTVAEFAARYQQEFGSTIEI